MNKIGKRLLALVLSLMMIIGFMPANVLAEKLSDTGYVELNDGYLSIKVSTKNGGFLIDTVEGDRLNKSDNNKFLLYPDENYDTSFTSFRVKRGSEVKDYIFGRSYGFLGTDSSYVEVEKNVDNIVAKWSVDGLNFKQTLVLLGESSDQHGMVYMSYGVESGDGRSVDGVEARILLDTALGFQDYAMYELLQPNGNYKSITHEEVVDGSDYDNAFFGYDDKKNPSITAYTVNASVDEKMIKPEKVAFGHWNNLAATKFDFTPDRNMAFTNTYNLEYLTADSAYALYYNMGSISAGGKGNTIATYYGVYSNVTVPDEEKVTLNFTKTPVPMVLNSKKDAYISQLNGVEDGDFEITTLIKNISGKYIDQLAVVVYAQEGIFNYDGNGNLKGDSNLADPHYIQILGLEKGEERPVTIRFNAKPLGETDYRKIELRVFDVYNTSGKFLADKQLGSRSQYVLCPGIVGGDKISFLSATPEAIFSRGNRNLYLTGQNFKLIRDTSLYKVKLHPMDGGKDVIVSSNNFVIDTVENTATVALGMDLSPGTWQLVLEWNDGKADTTSDALRFVVSENPVYQSVSYNIVTIEKVQGKDEYELKAYSKKDKYEDNDNVLLEFKGDFYLTYEGGKLVKADALSLKTTQGRASSTITISNSLDVEKGKVSIEVENVGTKNQRINTNIDGEVYTTGARTPVWTGVCALTSIKNGERIGLLQYDSMGNRDDVDTPITLLWPGAASIAQSIAGMIMDFRYCEFGIMENYNGTTQRVVSFGAQLSPNFLLPSNYDYKNQATSTMEKAQLKLAKSNYTADQLREVKTRYAMDQEAWEEAESGSLNIYIEDIIFGGKFIGFNASVEIGLPSYADGLPSIEGTLDLKVMNNEWELGVAGSADMVMLHMEAELRLRSYNGIPIPDKLYFYIGGFMPGINVDGHGVFWIQGAGGGVDGIYETLFPTSMIPPITLLLSGEFSLFTILTARADLSLSLRGISAELSNIGFKGLSIIDRLGMEIYWYPRIKLSAGIELNILDAILGEGYLLLEQQDDYSFFWEGYAKAQIQIPKKIFLIGGMKVGSAELGINQEKVWGAVRVLCVGVGVTYYWSGGVKFNVGSNGRQDIFGQGIAIAYDDSTGRTLYMAIDNARVLGTNNDNPTLLSTDPIKSDPAKRIHKFNLGEFGNEDGLMYVSFPTENLAEAKAKAEYITVPGYALNWMDDSLNADDPKNEKANASVIWDEDNKTASVAISFTEESSFNKEWTLNTPVAAEVTIYGMERLADLESVSYNETTKKATVKGDLDKFSKLAIYAVDKNENNWVVYQSEEKASIGTKEKDIEITFPEAMPSGEYFLNAVGTTIDESSNPIVNSVAFSYVNELQPKEPTTVDVVLGGDYSIDVTVTVPADISCDGYMATIYEEKDGKQIPTTLRNMKFPRGEDGKLPSMLTVGGQHYSTEYVDSKGEKVSRETEGAIEQSVLVGLEAGKSYKVGVTSYKNLKDDNGEDNGAILSSTEKVSGALNMVKPTPTKVTLKANGAVELSSNYSAENQQTFKIDHVKTSDVSISITTDVGTLRSGSYSLDDGKFVNWNKGQSINLTDLSEGTHKVIFRGENNTGDGMETMYQFTVDTLAPRLFIDDPVGGGFYKETLTITGISDEGAKIFAEIESRAIKNVTVGSDGTFTLDIPMDINVAYQDVNIYAEDLVGNQSKIVTFQMTNKLLGDEDAEALLYLGNVDVTNKSLDEGAKGQLSLKIKAGSKIIDVGQNSLIGSRINWELLSIEGSASLSETGYLTSNKGDNGMILASLGQLQAAAILDKEIETEVRLNKSELELMIGSEEKLIATVLPINLDLTWSSSSQEVATVDETGLIKALAEGETTITVATADKQYIATCKVNVTKQAYIVTMINGIDNTNKGPYVEGTVISIRANDPEIGKKFKEWTSSNGGSFANKDSSTTEFTMGKEATTLTATYGISKYTVIFVDHDEKELKKEEVEHGKDATAPENPIREGHKFTGWDKLFDNIIADITVKAQYNINKYTVKFEAGENGSITGKTEYVDIPFGTEWKSGVTVPTSEANAGYKFVNWTPVFPETVTENRTYTANFTESDSILITYSAGIGGRVDKTNEALSPATGIAAGSTATANLGYTFVNWTNGAGEVVSTTAKFVPEKVGELNVEATYTANFKENINISITYVAGTGGTIDNTSETLSPATGTAVGSTATANAGYTFVNWTNGAEVSTEAKLVPAKVNGLNVEATYTANFIKDTTKWHTVTFVSGSNGSIGETREYKDILTGTAWEKAVTVPTPVGATGYKFSGWTPAFPETVTENRTYIANFTENSNVVITYEAGLGGTVDKANETLLPATGVAVGSTAKENLGYTFVNWTNGAGTVVSTTAKFVPAKVNGLNVEATYTANFEKDESKWHTVKFVSGANGSITGTKEYSDILTGTAWATAITKLPETLANKGYKFSGWTPVFPETVTENRTYTVNFIEDTNVAITYVAGTGGSVDKTNETLLPATGVSLGSTAIASAGYTFVNWTKADGSEVSTTAKFVPAKVDGLNISETYTANFIKDKSKWHTVTFVSGANGSISGTIEYGDILTGTEWGAAITKLPETVAKTGYKFSGWTPSFPETVTESATYTANFTESDSILINYSAGIGGRVDPSNEALSPATGIAVGSTATANLGYTFANWTNSSGSEVGIEAKFVPAKVDGLNISETYTANFIKDKSKWHTVTFVSGANGSITGTKEYSDILTGTEWSTAVTVPTPVANVGYKFSGWTPSFPETVTENRTYTVNFIKEEAKLYTVRFVDYEGKELSKQEVEHGSSAIAPSEPTREGYRFTGWDKFFNNIVSDLIVTAQYSINKYIVTFKDYDEKVLKTEEVEHGNSAIAPSEPTREGYTFTGWDKSFDNVTADITIKAQYVEDAATTYTVIFADHNGTELRKQVVEEGKGATPPSDPTREGYTFTGWDKSFDNVTADITIKAQYEVVLVKSVNLNKTEANLIIGATEILVATVLPKDSLNKEVTWSSSDELIAKVDSDGKVTAISEGRATITVTTEDGEHTATCNVKVIKPSIPVKSISLDKLELSLTEGSIKTLIATINPQDATDRSVIWSSSDNLVAIVDNTGKVIAVKEGKTTIKVTTEDGNFTATCEVTVSKQLYTLTVINGTDNLKTGPYAVGTEISITANNRSEYTFIGWSSDDGVSFENRLSKTTTVTMPSKSITVTANYSMDTSDRNDDSANIPEIPSKPKGITTTVTKDTANVAISKAEILNAIKLAIEQARKNGTEKDGISVEIKVDTKNTSVNNLSVNLAKEALDELIKAGVKDIYINSEIGTINIDFETLTTIQKQLGSDVNISMEKVNNSTLSHEAKAVVGNRLVFDFEITGKDGQKVTEFGKGEITISLPYTLGNDEKAENIVAYYIDSEGKIHEVANSVYDEENGILTLKTDHFSKFAVGFKEEKRVINFTDIVNHWAKGDIEFVTSRGIFSGTGNEKFSPNIPMTRGMFVTVLGRFANVEVGNYRDINFVDIKSNAYYTNYVEWASKKGIVKGIGEGRFAPEMSITREQMAVIISNYLHSIDFQLPNIYAESTFADNGKISSYAKTAVKEMQMAGIISGKNDNKFDPKNTATRAEVSAVFKRLVELTEKK